MRTPSLRTAACALLAVTLWAGAASSGSAEPVAANHGWVEAGVGLAGGTLEVQGSRLAASAERGGVQANPSGGLEWRLRSLMIGGAGSAAEHVRTRLPLVEAIVRRGGGDLGDWFALVTWGGV